jgi:hypothetical protein
MVARNGAEKRHTSIDPAGLISLAQLVLEHVRRRREARRQDAQLAAQAEEAAAPALVAEGQFDRVGAEAPPTD